MDVLVEVWVAMCHCDADVCQLDLIIAIEVVVLLLCQDDVCNLLVIM